MKQYTNWSSPKTNLFTAMLCLRSALAAGENARLIRMHNQDCAFPIKYKEDPKKVDFRGYTFSIGYQATYDDIQKGNTQYNPELSLNYMSVYGTVEAMKKYYDTGVLSGDNFKGMGKNHLVKVDDAIEFLKSQPASDKWSHQRAKSLHAQYRDPATRNQRFFFDFFTKEHGNEWVIKKFKHMLWVVELLDKKEPQAKVPVLIKTFNVLCSPVFFIMKWIPRKSILDMKEYKNVTYRVGGVTNGWSVQIQIPRKFSFK